MAPAPLLASRRLDRGERALRLLALTTLAAPLILAANLEPAALDLSLTHALTGLDGADSGLLAAWSLTLRGDLVGALSRHPVAPPLLAAALVEAVSLTLETGSGCSLGLPSWQRVRSWLWPGLAWASLAVGLTRLVSGLIA